MEGSGLPIEALGHAMMHATEAHGENPLFDFERGKMTEAEFFALLGEGLSERSAAASPLQDFAEHYFSHLSPNHELIDHLQALRDERGLRLALLTNNVREWEPRWKSMLPDDMFELIVDSAFVGMRKPEPGIYELTLERLGLPGEACAFIDDLEINCDAAREHGIHPIRFESTAQVSRSSTRLLDGSRRRTAAPALLFVTRLEARPAPDRGDLELLVLPQLFDDAVHAATDHALGGRAEDRPGVVEEQDALGRRGSRARCARRSAPGRGRGRRRRTRGRVGGPS